MSRIDAEKGNTLKEDTAVLVRDRYMDQAEIKLYFYDLVAGLYEHVKYFNMASLFLFIFSQHTRWPTNNIMKYQCIINI